MSRTITLLEFKDKILEGAAKRFGATRIVYNHIGCFYTLYKVDGDAHSEMTITNDTILKHWNQLQEKLK